MKLKRILIGLFTLTCMNSSVYALSAVHISGGLIGEPERLRGGRISVTDNWRWVLPSKDHAWELHGYWDYSIAYWFTQIKVSGEPSSIVALAAAPVLRLEKLHTEYFKPFLEASLGAVWLSHSRLGHRNVGSQINFQDMLGVGTYFGAKQQYEISGHYLHYSNAGIFPPNNGLDVKLLVTLAYHI
jgi:hypothetical protein